MHGIWILTFFLLQTTWAASSRPDLLKCLGQEEKKFHQHKKSGPLYDLNQRIIAEMVQIPSVAVTPEVFSTICSAQVNSPSLKLLELSIRKGSEIFIIPKEIIGSQRLMTQGMIEDYMDSTREIFLTFISQIQTLSPSPDCLRREIPELDTFFTEIKYLQEDVDLKQIFAGKDLKIFEKLLHYPQAFQKCRVRLKKKPKSESTDSPKKT